VLLFGVIFILVLFSFLERDRESLVKRGEYSEIIFGMKRIQTALLILQRTHEGLLPCSERAARVLRVAHFGLAGPQAGLGCGGMHTALGAVSEMRGAPPTPHSVRDQTPFMIVLVDV
jgi:hypothetical protein